MVHSQCLSVIAWLMSIAKTLYQPKGHIILDNYNVPNNSQHSLFNELKHYYIKDLERDFKTYIFLETHIY